MFVDELKHYQDYAGSEDEEEDYNYKRDAKINLHLFSFVVKNTSKIYFKILHLFNHSFS